MIHPWLALLALLAGLALYTLTVMADAALARVGRGEVHRLAEHRHAGAARLEVVMARKQRWMTTAILLRVASMLAAGVALAWPLSSAASGLWLLAGAVVVWLVFTLAQLSGRAWVQHDPLRWSLRLLPFVRATMALLRPVTAMLRQATERVEAAVHADEDSILLSDDGVRLLLPSDSEETEIEETEKEMITSILEMDETVAREVMVPRTDMVAFEAETRLGDVVDVILEAGHSRIPVYEGSVDQIIGLLYAKDLLRALQQSRADEPIRGVLRPAYFVPSTKNVKHLLAEMRKHRVHMAVVVDEYGGTAGLVTIEDILEEIVGEIQDEYDAAEETLVHRLGADSWLIQARLDNYSLSKLLDIDVEDDDADTVGGLVLGLLGHVAEAGESVEIQGWRMTVLKVDGRRIDQVRVERVQGKTSGEADATADATADSLPARSSRTAANSV